MNGSSASSCWPSSGLRWPLPTGAASCWALSVWARTASRSSITRAQQGRPARRRRRKRPRPAPCQPRRPRLGCPAAHRRPRLPPPRAGPPARRAAAGHPAPGHPARPAPPGTLRPLEDILTLLSRAGFTGPDALHIYRALFGFLRGHVLNELQELIDNPDETDDLLRPAPAADHRIPRAAQPRPRPGRLRRRHRTRTRPRHPPHRTGHRANPRRRCTRHTPAPPRPRPPLARDPTNPARAGRAYSRHDTPGGRPAAPRRA